MSKKIKIFEAFSGIGSQHQALLNLGYKVEVVGISDWFIDAIIAYGIKFLDLKPIEIDRDKEVDFLSKYSLSHDSKKPLKKLSSINNPKLSILFQVIKKYGDLDIHNLKGQSLVGKDIDLFTYSFPCQDISQQGLQKGFSKGTSSRSGLLWEVERVLKEIKSIDKDSLPKILMMENVKALLGDKFAGDLNNWTRELKKLGYRSTDPFLVDASELGETQKRQRVFMISYLGDKEPLKFKVDRDKYTHKYLKDIFEKNMPHNRFKISSKYEIIHKKTISGIKKSFIEGYTNFNRENYVYFLDGKSPTITASGAQSRIKIFNQDGQIVYLNGYEHLKLQGFTDKDFYDKLVNIGISETRIKYLAGNSINIKMLEEIFRYYL